MGGSSKQTSTSTAEPYKASKPLLDQGMGDALKLYKDGNLVQPNTMSTVVPYAEQTMQGMGDLTNIAQNNMGGQGLSGQLQGIINSGGYNQEQQTALDGIRSTATGQFNINEDPGFQQVLDKTQNAVNQNAAGLGRYGSGTHTGVMTQELGDLGARQYQQYQARKDAAQQQLFNAGQQGQQNLSSAYETAQDPAKTLMGVGGMYEDLYGRTLNDQLRIANETQNAPLANIQSLLAVANGGGQYGTNTQTAQGPSNTLSNIAGAGLGAMSMGTSGGGKL
ncbi:hypothetical protein [Aquamicrobium defluvii]|uniref:Uncharacterized protein n=1 Tax=Aquamicrobium defluvii TaxID=69279 RepID=A0A4R6YEC2_9HYPH|nr:hypothetical protein [Aquamicrobium defluvii]TDR34334.1 hypothetical protein DES43_115104 [Aquamicrobium defluvii]